MEGLSPLLRLVHFFRLRALPERFEQWLARDRSQCARGRPPASFGGMRTPGFLFPGQLSEAIGMGRDFYDADPAARELFERTSRLCGRDLVSILFSGPEGALHENLAAQAGVYLVSTLACRALEAEGLRPPATAGYSLGNYAALCAAGAISYDEGLEVLVAVWRETERLGIRGAMGAVVGARREAVEGVCERLREEGLLVWIGNVNSATQFVLTGQEEAVAAALEALSAARPHRPDPLR